MKDSFIHITDIHFWEVVRNPLLLLNKRLLGNINVSLRRQHEFDTAQASSFLDYALGLDVPDVVFTGDFTSTATHGEFRQARAFLDQAAASGKRMLVYPGNHDVYTFESARKRRFEEYLSRWQLDAPLPALHSLTNGTPLLTVPTVCPNLLSSRGRITDAEVARAAALMKDLPEPLLVTGHYPLLITTAAYHSKPSRRLRNSEALRQVLGATGKRTLYVAGHVHRFSYEQDPEYANLTHLTSGAFLRHAPESGIQGDFSEIHCSNEGFRVFRHRYAGTWTRNETASPSL